MIMHEYRLESCHPDLVKVILMLEKLFPKWTITIAYGFRNQTDQNLAFAQGNSTKQWPNSLHNSQPSMAVDLYAEELDPNGALIIDFKDYTRIGFLAGMIVAIGIGLGIGIRWGGDWDGDTETKDEHLKDLGHFELIKQEATAPSV